MDRDERVSENGSDSRPVASLSESSELDRPVEEGGFDRPESLIPSSNVEQAEIPWLVDTGGNVGIVLGIVALGLAIAGVLAGWLRIQPLADMVLVSSLILIFVAMLLGIVYQVFVMRS